MVERTDLATILAPIRQDLEQLEGHLRAIASHAAPPLDAMLAHALRGGKRLRPALVLLVSRLFGPAHDGAVRLAGALDVLHAATLIHDDLVDQSALRRGRGTLHTLWPAAACILAGDYLLAEAVALVAEVANPAVLAHFGALLRALCAGEIYQIVNGRAGTVDRAACYRHIEAKTASLFAAAAEMAALLAGAGPAQIAAVRCYGRELGLAFQIVDDILDLTADEATLGKPGASDLRQGIITLPLLLYLEQNPADTAVRAVLSGDRTEPAVQQALCAVRISTAIPQALGIARTHVTSAIQALTPCPAGPGRISLCSLARYVVDLAP
jgi:geranylgeranyl pyrophosphate synthase